MHVHGALRQCYALPAFLTALTSLSSRPYLSIGTGIRLIA
jgi:hypothetical protein